MISINTLKPLAEKHKKKHKKCLDNLKKMKSHNVDLLFEDAHEKVFSKIDCLSCANCCKTTGPLFTNKDIERISIELKLKPGTFVEKYLKIDDENDYVLQQLPCPFLKEDNYCSIYDVRPKACREYPHTDHSPMQQIFNLTLKNATICPAVFEVLEEISNA